MLAANTVLFLLITLECQAQHYILKSEPPNLGGTEVCPVTIEITCIGIRVGVLYWNTTIDGSELVLASHSGGNGENYRIQLNLSGISYLSPSIDHRYPDPAQFDVNATISIVLSNVVNQNADSFYCGSTDHTFSSNRYSTDVTVIGPPPAPSFIGCCIQSDSASSDPITCSIKSSSEIGLHWSSRYSSRFHIGRYRLLFDERLDAPDCLTSQFASPNETCIFSGLNNSTEYKFNISAINCDVQESPQTNATISLASLLVPVRLEGVSVNPVYGNNFQLTKIMVKWNFLEPRCPGLDYDYKIFLKNSSSFVVDNLTTRCTRGVICTSEILVSSSYDLYVVEIIVYNNFEQKTMAASYVSDPLAGFSGQRTSFAVAFSDCFTSASCVSSVDGKCEIRIVENSTDLTSGDPIEGLINDTINLRNLIPNRDYYYEAIFTINSTFIIVGNFTTVEDTERITDANIGWIVAGIVLFSFYIVLLVAFLIMLPWQKKKIFAIILGTSSVGMLAIDVILWITVMILVLPQTNTCDISWQSSRDGLIIAIVIINIIFFIILLLSTLVIVKYKFCKPGDKPVAASSNNPAQETLNYYCVDDEAKQMNVHGISKAEGNLSATGHKIIGETTNQSLFRVKEEVHQAITTVNQDDEAKKMNVHGISKAEGYGYLSRAGHKKIGETTNQGLFRVTEEVHQAITTVYQEQSSNTYDKINREGQFTKEKEEHLLPPGEYGGLDNGGASEGQEYESLKHGGSVQPKTAVTSNPRYSPNEYDHIGQVYKDSHRWDRIDADETTGIGGLQEQDPQSTKQSRLPKFGRH